MVYTAFTFNGITLKALSVSATKVAATRKQKIGQHVVLNQVFTNSFEWHIVIRGELVGSAASIDATRTLLNNSQDGFKHAYVDGLHDGNFVMLEPVDFGDDGSRAAPVTNLRYTLVLRQDIFAGGTL